MLKAIIQYLARITGAESELIDQYRNMNKQIQEQNARLEQRLLNIERRLDDCEAQHAKDHGEMSELRRRIAAAEEKERADQIALRVLREAKEKLEATVIELQRRLATLEQRSTDHGIAN